jgi:hypothetical protein
VGLLINTYLNAGYDSTARLDWKIVDFSVKITWAMVEWAETSLPAHKRLFR